MVDINEVLAKSICSLDPEHASYLRSDNTLCKFVKGKWVCKPAVCNRDKTSKDYLSWDWK